MQLIKLVLHGILKDRYESFAVAGSTPAEAIEGWSRQVGCGQSVPIQVVGYNDLTKLADKTDATELHLVPAMFGGGGNVGRIIIGAALIVGGILLTPVVGPAIGAAMISAGIGMALGGIMGLFMKQPTVSKEEDPEASKYIGTGKNTTGVGTIIGRGGGRMLIGGHFLSLQVNSSDMIVGKYPATPT